jgi:uncharacterized coiled-coil DUF342 family protein
LGNDDDIPNLPETETDLLRATLSEERQTRKVYEQRVQLEYNEWVRTERQLLAQIADLRREANAMRTELKAAHWEVQTLQSSFEEERAAWKEYFQEVDKSFHEWNRICGDLSEKVREASKFRDGALEELAKIDQEKELARKEADKAKEQLILFMKAQQKLAETSGPKKTVLSALNWLKPEAGKKGEALP